MIHQKQKEIIKRKLTIFPSLIILQYKWIFLPLLEFSLITQILSSEKVLCSQTKKFFRDFFLRSQRAALGCLLFHTIFATISFLPHSHISVSNFYSCSWMWKNWRPITLFEKLSKCLILQHFKRKGKQTADILITNVNKQLTLLP